MKKLTAVLLALLLVVPGLTAGRAEMMFDDEFDDSFFPSAEEENTVGGYTEDSFPSGSFFPEDGERISLGEYVDIVDPTGSIHCGRHPDAMLYHYYGEYVVRATDEYHYDYPYSFYICSECEDWNPMYEEGDEQIRYHTFERGVCTVCGYRRSGDGSLSSVPDSPSRRRPDGSLSSTPDSPSRRRPDGSLSSTPDSTSRRRPDGSLSPEPSAVDVDGICWDTQFRPGLSDKNNKVSQLSRLSDGNPATVFNYTQWYSERTDDIPELTAYPGGMTVSTILLRNGDVSGSENYYSNARLKKLRVVVRCSSGTVDQTFEIPDVYCTGWQLFPLRSTCRGVTQIDFYLGNCYQGSSRTWNVCISDLSFH